MRKTLKKKRYSIPVKLLSNEAHLSYRPLCLLYQPDFKSSSAFSPCSTGNSPSLVICRTLYSCVFPPRYFSLFPPFFPQPSLPLCLLSNLAAPVSLIPGVVRRVIMIEKIHPKNSSPGGGLQIFPSSVEFMSVRNMNTEVKKKV